MTELLPHSGVEVSSSSIGLYGGLVLGRAGGVFGTNLHDTLLLPVTGLITGLPLKLAIGRYPSDSYNRWAYGCRAPVSSLATAYPSPRAASSKARNRIQARPCPRASGATYIRLISQAPSGSRLRPPPQTGRPSRYPAR